MAKYDFDQLIPRRGTNSVKWDEEPAADILPMWVADMDFRTAPCVVEALRRRGIRTYVLSNNNPASMKYIRRMFTADGKTMDDYFDAVFLSYELHELKPSEAIFRKMIAAGGMRPEETLFIDDGQKNVDAAQRLGFAVYMPGPGEDFGHILDNLNRYEEIL